MFAGRAFVSRKRIRANAGPKSLVPVSASKAEINLAAKVVKLSKLVKGLKVEIKYIDAALGTSNVPVTGYVAHMTPVGQGTAVNARVGDLISTIWWELNFHARFTDSVLTSLSQDPTFRFYVVQDLQQIADTPPTMADLVDNPQSPNIQLLTLQTTLQKRFRVLYDSKPQIMVPGTFLAPSNNSVVFPFKIQFNLHRRLKSSVRFNGAAVTDQQKGAIYLMVSSNMVDAAPAGTFDFQATSRVAYSDA